MRFTCAPADQLPFPDRSFDLVTAFDVLEHTDDDARVLEELTRVTSPGGALAMTVPAYQWMWGRQDEISGHRRRYSTRLLRQRVATAGLRLERLTPFNTLLFPAAAVIRLLRRQGQPQPNCGAPALESDFSMVGPGPLNNALAILFGTERLWLRRWDFPVGVSLFALARRPIN